MKLNFWSYFIFIVASFQLLHGMQTDKQKKIDWKLINGNCTSIKEYTQPRSDYQALKEATQKQDYAQVQRMLEAGTKPNPPDNFSESDRGEPIRYARSIPLAKLLIAHGASIPDDILNEDCSKKDFPTDLIVFYLHQEKKIQTSLHTLAAPTYISIGLPMNGGFYVGDSQQRGWPTYVIPKMENSENVKMRSEKAALFAFAGKKLYYQLPDTKETALHYAAQIHDITFCEILIELNKKLSTLEYKIFLACLKRLNTPLYPQKDLLKLMWKKSINYFLELKNTNGQTAFECCDPYWKADWLKPK